MKLTIPLMYPDAEVRVVPGDEHNPPMAIPIAEHVELETCVEPFHPRLVKLTLPPGRQSALLPRELFSHKFLAKGGLL